MPAARLSWRPSLALAAVLAVLGWGCDGPVCEPGYTFCTQTNHYLARCDPTGNIKGYECTAKCAELKAKGPGYCGFSSTAGHFGCLCADGVQWSPP